jgi:hypothetical protein
MNLKNIKTFLVILLVTVFVANTGFSGPRNKLGTSAAPELLIPVGSIGTALSGSNLSTISGIDAMYWNPAGLSSLSTKTGEVMFSHMNYIADMKVEYFGGVAKLGNLGVIGLAIKAFNIGDIQETTEIQPEGTGSIFRPTYTIMNISLARQMTDRIRFGTNFKLINESVAGVNSSGFGMDFGLQYIGGTSGLSFGIVLKNLGPSMTFDGQGLDRTITINGQTSTQRVILQSFDLPTNLEIGVGYAPKLGKDNYVNISAAFQNSSFSSDEYKVGLEYSYKQYFYIRGAMSYYADKNAGESLWGPTFGAGLKYPVGSMTLGFDYAYRIVNESAFNSTNQFFTLNVGF